jgi:hypothetical protein
MSFVEARRLYRPRSSVPSGNTRRFEDKGVEELLPNIEQVRVFGHMYM